MHNFDPDELATGLVRVAADGRIEWFNRSANALLAPPGASLKQHSIQQLSPALGEWVEQVSAQGRSLHAPEALLEDGTTVVDAYLHPVGNAILIELHPITERVRQREMAERADREQALSLMTRRLAHELRNPLAGVRGAAQLIAARGSDDASSRHAAMIQREADRITSLIDRFAGNGERHASPINLHRVLAEAAELVAAEQHGRLRVERDFDPSIPELSADEGQMHQLFLNLLRNSAQAGASLVRLTTRIEHNSPLLDRPGGPAVRVDLDDDGSGVPDTLRDKLFLPLVSGRDQGSGFGLAIVQQIARSHGGLVEYRPLEHGSRFRIRLPLEPTANPPDLEDHDV
ncbi:two-component system sensor histidine kinase NtrB [Wenzhouxiangella sp. EGI_FJ10305]|uniref:two-component system sensor histidine kinase NtrB n=1 Tax=Wenzhouxiangella sp. EGI_FJ10305 TaxID=3243768 RepID=UPI0035DA82B9